jgi:hypothetical protein
MSTDLKIAGVGMGRYVWILCCLLASSMALMVAFRGFYKEIVVQIPASYSNEFRGLLIHTPVPQAEIIIGILSTNAERDELMYNNSIHFDGIRNGMVKMFFVRCRGLDDNTVTNASSAWTVHINCSLDGRAFELCHKTLGWLNYATSHFPHAKFVAKSDDDSYIQVDRLLSLMTNLSHTWPSTNLYVGRGMQIFASLHNGLCFGPVPFMGGMMEIFSPALIPEIQCSGSVIGGMGEDFVIGHSLMHTRVHHLLISCSECFHYKEIQLSVNSVVVHGFKEGSLTQIRNVASALSKPWDAAHGYSAVFHWSHTEQHAHFHLWGSRCSNGCISVASTHSSSASRLVQFAGRAVKGPVVVFDVGLAPQDLLELSYSLRRTIDLQRFPSFNPSKEEMMQRVSLLYNTTCLNWIDDM